MRETFILRGWVASPEKGVAGEQHPFWRCARCTISFLCSIHDTGRRRDAAPDHMHSLRGRHTFWEKTKGHTSVGQKGILQRTFHGGKYCSYTTQKQPASVLATVAPHQTLAILLWLQANTEQDQSSCIIIRRDYLPFFSCSPKNKTKYYLQPPIRMNYSAIQPAAKASTCRGVAGWKKKKKCRKKNLPPITSAYISMWSCECLRKLQE